MAKPMPRAPPVTTAILPVNGLSDMNASEFYENGGSAENSGTTKLDTALGLPYHKDRMHDSIAPGWRQIIDRHCTTLVDDLTAQIDAEIESSITRAVEEERTRSAAELSRHVAEERLRAEADVARAVEEERNRLLTEERARSTAAIAKTVEEERTRAADAARLLSEARARADADAARVADEERSRVAADIARILAESRARTEAEFARAVGEEHTRTVAESGRLLAEEKSRISTAITLAIEEERVRSSAELERALTEDRARAAADTARAVEEEHTRTKAEMDGALKEEAARALDDERARAAADAKRMQADWRIRADSEVARTVEEERVRAADELARLLAEERVRGDAEAARAVEEERRRHAAEVKRLLVEEEPAQTRRVSELFNQTLRRIRQTSAEHETLQLLLEDSSDCAERAVIVLIENNQARVVSWRNAKLRDDEEEGSPIELGEAAALKSCVESHDPVVALAAPAEVSTVLAAALGGSDTDKVYLFPITVHRATVALLLAAGAVTPASVEVLCEAAGMKLESFEVSAGATATEKQVIESVPFVQIASAATATSGGGTSPRAIAASEQAPTVTPEDREIHLRAQRTARVRVAQMRISHSEALRKGVQTANIYDALRPSIDSARAEFEALYVSHSPKMVDYLHLEMLRSLAHDDRHLLGPDYPGPLA